MNRQKRFRDFFCFHKDIRSQSLKIACLRSQQLHKNTIFSLDTEILIFLNFSIGCVNTPNNFILSDCSFKVSQSLFGLVVNNYVDMQFSKSIKEKFLHY